MARSLDDGIPTIKIYARWAKSMMANLTQPTITLLGLALGRIPSGLFILTVRRDDQTTGMLLSWVQQAGFNPPMLTVAVRRNRYISDWIQVTGRFTLNQIPANHKMLLRHFAHGFPPGADAFSGVSLYPESASGGPILADALAYLDAEVVALLTAGDHCLFLARIVAGGLLNPDCEPFVHIRNDGSNY
jgi:flavin reductase (DIM6/NTAB) family NADH-FMN oxidoreductase RutF